MYYIYNYLMQTRSSAVGGLSWYFSKGLTMFQLNAKEWLEPTRIAIKLVLSFSHIIYV